MLKEALQYLVSLAPFNQIETPDGRQYADKPIIPIREDLPAALGVSTLTGFVGAIEHNVGRYDPLDVVVVVRAADRVELVRAGTDDWNRRQVYSGARCEAFVSKFPFGRFMSAEEFIVGLLTNFVVTPDLSELLRIASNLSAEQVTIADDDGISQKVTMKKGVVLKGTSVVRPRVELAPFRSFVEVEQPVSSFIFRLRGGDPAAPPLCALFEADGRRWEQTAMMSVQKWLAEHVKLPVIA